MYIFTPHNYLTLCKTIKYIDTVAKNEKSLIIYTDGVQPLPERISEKYSVICVKSRQKKSKSRFGSIVNTMKTAREMSSVVCNAIGRTSEDVTLVVFKDTECKEATFIERAYKKYRKRIKIILIEEGLGVYQKKTLNVSNYWFKRIMYFLGGVSKYSLKGNPHGVNPHLEKVIVTNPDLMREKYAEWNVDIEIEKQLDVFDKELCDYFVNIVSGEDFGFEKCDFVLITMPMNEVLGRRYENYKEVYSEFLKKLIAVTDKKGKLLIKAHPRDKFDYSPFISDKVKVCSEKQNLIPFECIYNHLQKPRLLTLYSSAVTGVDTDKASLFLYKLIGIERLTFDVSEEFLRDNNIIDCKSFEHLEEIL